MSKNLLIDAHLKRLRMPTVARFYSDLARDAEINNHTFEAYLLALLDLEVQQRDLSTQQGRIKAAKFPLVKTLDQFNFSVVPDLNQSRILTLSQNDYIDRHENVLMIGPTGVGKTHLAIGLGIAACRACKRVRFTTTPALVNELLEARQDRRLARVQNAYQRFQLLVLDEFGFVPFPRDGSELLFNLIASRHEVGSTILTSNLEFSRWTEVIGDETLAGALVDRLTHHAHIIQVKGDSYRFRESLQSRARRSSSKPDDNDV